MKPFRWGMINPMTGEPFAFDDANVQWADPAFYLEPGDPGFVPYPSREPGLMEARIGTHVMHSLDHFIRDQGPARGRFPDSVPTAEEGSQNCDDFGVSSERGADISQSGMDVAVSETTGVPPEKCAEVLGAYLDQLLVGAHGSPLAKGIYDLLTINPKPGAGGNAVKGAKLPPRPVAYGQGVAQSGRHP